MAPRDYTSTPVSDELNLKEIILGLANDLTALRNKEITPNEAIARANLAKQIWNGARLYLQAANYLAGASKDKPAPDGKMIE